jgi:small-conductance mechanosensitive channel
MMTIESFLASVNLIFNKILYPLSNLFLALLILLIVLLVARFLRNIVTMFLKTVQLDAALEKVKFNKLLEKADIRKTTSELFGELVYWLVIFVVVLGLAAMVGIPIETALDRVMSFTGIVLLAAITLSLGTFLSILIAQMVFLIGSNLGFAGSKTISRLIQYATVIFAFLLALEQLGIGPALLVPSIGVIIGAVGLAVAIAFGLGCKDIMADFVSNLIKGK